MSLRLLLDEDIQGRRLVQLLIEAGHNVLTVNDIGFVREKDPRVFEYARENNRILITHNCKDFQLLHEQNLNKGLEHSGILGVYRYNNPLKDLSPEKIIKAIHNLETNSFECKNQFISLNTWNY